MHYIDLQTLREKLPELSNWFFKVRFCVVRNRFDSFDVMSFNGFIFALLYVQKKNSSYFIDERNYEWKIRLKQKKIPKAKDENHAF